MANFPARRLDLGRNTPIGHASRDRPVPCAMLLTQAGGSRNGRSGRPSLYGGITHVSRIGADALAGDWGDRSTARCHCDHPDWLDGTAWASFTGLCGFFVCHCTREANGPIAAGSGIGHSCSERGPIRPSRDLPGHDHPFFRGLRRRHSGTCGCHAEDRDTASSSLQRAWWQLPRLRGGRSQVPNRRG